MSIGWKTGGKDMYPKKGNEFDDVQLLKSSEVPSIWMSGIFEKKKSAGHEEGSQIEFEL